MATKDVFVNIENQSLKLSNLDKVLFQEGAITKAQVIEYYLAKAPMMLPFLKARPLTLIRFPDGIAKNSFYSKNKADHTPDWIKSSSLPDRPDIMYVEANNTASLVYLANLAAIELHAMPIKSDHFGPDHFIFDLDPSPDIPFQDIVALAYELKSFLENEGFNPYLKTSGSKGLHIYVPIVPNVGSDAVIEKCKDLSRKFIQTHSNSTLSINKERRAGKILLDIYRNHKAQTCVAPYSIRALPGAPISCPIAWSQLSEISSSQAYNIFSTVTENPWADFESKATELLGTMNSITLDSYAKKRDFNISPEPKPTIIPEVNLGPPRYVIHKHNASNLHYDLRLEDAGVLLSWAIPKAIPHLPNVKRLAIATEPHPISYLTFEGTIPKEEYGGGEMWIFDSGEFVFIEKTDKKILFELKKGQMAGRYLIYHTEENKWIIERKSIVDNLVPNTEPMLASMGSKIRAAFHYEIKWDGIRVSIIKNAEEIKILSRNQNDITSKFPELVLAAKEIDAEMAVIDAEIVVLDAAGKPVFANIISRMHAKDPKIAQKYPSTLYCFDLMYLDSQDLRNRVLETRRDWLKVIFKEQHNLRFSHAFEDGTALLAAIKEQNMEGIIGKKKGSLYKSGQRGDDWFKIKLNATDDAYIIGYTKGNGDRSNLFGALHLAKNIDQTWVYKGKVGTGFNETSLSLIFEQLKKIEVGAKPIKDAIDEEYNTIWVKPDLMCEIKYASMTSNNTYREPVFVKLIDAN